MTMTTILGILVVLLLVAFWRADRAGVEHRARADASSAIIRSLEREVDRLVADLEMMRQPTLYTDSAAEIPDDPKSVADADREVVEAERARRIREFYVPVRVQGSDVAPAIDLAEDEFERAEIADPMRDFTANTATDDDDGN